VSSSRRRPASRRSITPAAPPSIGQLLSHSGGLTRDGTDSRFWTDQTPFPDRTELLGILSSKPLLDSEVRFKYSNAGYGLLSLIIEGATGAGIMTGSLPM
jgi:D-alanyl-D-alanine carboxypeptidase